MASFRVKRVQEEVLGFVSSLLRRYNDPDFSLVTLSECQMSPDLKNAYLYYTYFTPAESDETKLGAKIAADLDNVRAEIRKEVGAGLRLKFTPQIHFRFDDAAVFGSKIDRILDQLK